MWSFPCSPRCGESLRDAVPHEAHKFSKLAARQIDVNGSSAHPLYKWLKAKKPGIMGTKGIKVGRPRALLPVVAHSPWHPAQWCARKRSAH